MIDYSVTFSETALRTLVNDPLLTPERARACPAGLNRLNGRLEFLVHRAEANVPRPEGDAPRVVILPENRPELLMRRLDDAPFYAPSGALAVVLTMGVGAAAGRLAGVVRAGASLVPLQRVRIAAAGLHDIGLVALEADQSLPGPDDAWPWPEEEVLSRTIGALGIGTWQRLRALHVALVGCGRTGSLAASELRRLGVRRLTLVDPDRLEPHNLGEMDAVGPSHVGQNKAVALASALESRNGQLAGRDFKVVSESMLSQSSLVALKTADILVCCADDPAARLATGLLAVLYLKPLLDIGTGVLHGPGPGSRRLGADIRLVLPGRCLMCTGGVADLAAARRNLRQGGADRSSAEWQHQRLGSLRSLNGVGVNLGLRLLEDMVASRRLETTWLRLEVDAGGIPRLETRNGASTLNCPVCALTGAGDGGLPDVQRFVEG